MATSNTELTLFLSIRLARFNRLALASLKMHLASLGAELHRGRAPPRRQGHITPPRVRDGEEPLVDPGERAKRASFEEDEHSRDESREIANRLYIYSTELTLFHSITFASLVLLLLH